MILLIVRPVDSNCYTQMKCAELHYAYLQGSQVTASGATIESNCRFLKSILYHRLRLHLSGFDFTHQP